MRLRLGLLQDTAAIDKQVAREAAEAQAKKHKLEIPTVKTEAQAKLEEATAAKEKEKGLEKIKPSLMPKARIRPLSEAKAIDSGANFISEAFLFLVGGSLIVFETWRSRRKETNRREDVAERMSELEENEKAARRALVELEKEILRLRAKESKLPPLTKKRILPKEIWELEEQEEREEEVESKGWVSWAKGLLNTEAEPQASAAEFTTPNQPLDKATSISSSPSTPNTVKAASSAHTTK
ncbi:hypothetical protein MMC12_002209 [Toensbergia leucococca]|nr:hypothetical protein [Toensbergia leucococca]